VADRKIIESTLARTNLTDHDLANVAYSPTAVMPDVRVVKIGGQSVMDRGRAALFPILDELVAARKEGIAVGVLVGGGTRARHIYSIASELEMPVGVMATLGKYIPMQNARMVQMLLAKHGGLYILPDDFEKLPLYLQLGCLPVMSGMPRSATGRSARRAAASRAPHRRRRVPVGRVPGREASHLHQGRGRPVHRRRRRTPRRPTSRGSRSPSSRPATCPTWSSSASCSTTSQARACRLQIVNGTARQRPGRPAREDVRTIIHAWLMGGSRETLPARSRRRRGYKTF
jgi:hypothetical protein